MTKPVMSRGTSPWAGDLVFKIECRGERGASKGPRHEVTICSDWSVVTPHDLEAERVAMAFGGYNSCVDLVDKTIPLLRTKLGLVARTIRPQPQQDKQGGWRVPSPDTAACCRGRVFATLRANVEHLRSAEHLARDSVQSRWQVATVVRAVGLASRPDVSDNAPAARYIRDSGGLEQLWRAGIRPDEIAAMARWASAVDEPLPVSFFEAIAYSGNDPTWLDSVLRHRPDADTATWLAWLTPPHLVSEPDEVGLWLGFGVSPKDFEVALRHILAGSRVFEVVAATGWSQRTAARNVIDWAKARCLPTPAHFAKLARHGLEYARPGVGAIEMVSAEVTRLGTPIDWTELGVMLALAGNRPSLLAAVNQGARNAMDLLDLQSAVVATSDDHHNKSGTTSDGAMGRESS